MTLFDDRITRVSAKAPTNIAIDNIDKCLIWTKRNHNADYTILAFKPKKKNLAMSLFGVLTETAISDPLIVEKVVENLKGKGIPVAIFGGTPKVNDSLLKKTSGMKD